MNSLIFFNLKLRYKRLYNNITTIKVFNDLTSITYTLLNVDVYKLKCL